MALRQEQHGADIVGLTRGGNDDVDDDAMATSLHQVARNGKPLSAAMEAEAAASLTKILSLLSELEEEAQRHRSAAVEHEKPALVLTLAAAV